jgi:SSS family solute:Na+ symporter
MNFLHFAVVMFVICVAVLVGVSLATAAPDRRKVAGLTWATDEQQIDTSAAGQGAAAMPLAPESEAWRRRNQAAAGVLIATMIGLWIYYR